MKNITTTQKNIRRRDRLSGMVAVMVIFSVCCSICLYYFISTSQTDMSSYKDVIVKKSQRQQTYRDAMADHKTTCDSLFMRIERFDPAVNASFEENDIKFLINDLRGVYEQNAWDKRYKVFSHVAGFYEMWFADKKILWSKKDNIRKFSSNLEKCEMGLTKKEEELKTKQTQR